MSHNILYSRKKIHIYISWEFNLIFQFSFFYHLCLYTYSGFHVSRAGWVRRVNEVGAVETACGVSAEDALEI